MQQKKKFVLLAVILSVVLCVGALLAIKNPDVLSAKSVSQVISEGLDGSTTANEQRLPEIPGQTAEEKVDNAVLTAINIILYICGTVAGVMIIVGAIRYVISAGDEDMMTGAKKTILWSAGGFVMVLLSWAIVLNIVRIGSLDQRLDNSGFSATSQCNPDVTMGCKGVCCGCSTGEIKIGCDDGLQCGGPMDIKSVLGSIKVCQPSTTNQ